MLQKKENDRKKEIYEGYEQLAFGSVADAIKLLFLEEPNPRTLKRMDFFNVAEIRRMKEGAMEIKFFDRLKALEKLEEIMENRESEAPPFYEALENSAKIIKEQQEETL